MAEQQDLFGPLPVSTAPPTRRAKVYTRDLYWCPYCAQIALQPVGEGKYRCVYPYCPGPQLDDIRRLVRKES
jgi:hypothetical protein